MSENHQNPPELVQPPQLEGAVLPAVVELQHHHAIGVPHQEVVAPAPSLAFPDPVAHMPSVPEVMAPQEQEPLEESAPEAENEADADAASGKRPRSSNVIAVRKPPPKKPRRDSKEARASWNDNLFQLLKFKAEHGHTDVPEDHPLYFWVYTQRKNKRQKNWRQQHGKPENHGTRKLTNDHIKVLDCVQFTWDPYKRSIEEKWKQRFDELVDFKEQHGHTNVPQKSNARGLSSWVKVQRMNYTHAQKQKDGEKLASEHCVALSQERMEMLNSIGFEWRVKKVAQGWDARFQQLLEYKAINGDTLVPFNYVNQHGRLGRWVNKQRHEMTLKLRGEKSQLTNEREARLNEIGFRWVAPGFQKKTVKDWNNPHETFNAAETNDNRNVAMAHAPHGPAAVATIPQHHQHHVPHPHHDPRFNEETKEEQV